MVAVAPPNGGAVNHSLQQATGSQIPLSTCKKKYRKSLSSKELRIIFMTRQLPAKLLGETVIEVPK